MAPKRKSPDVPTESSKRIRLSSDILPNTICTSSLKGAVARMMQSPKKQLNVRPKGTKNGTSFKGNVRKLAPPKPLFVPITGSKSTHAERKNVICISRKTPLGSYLSRCKTLLVEEGNNKLYLHAMGAAIPHLLMLTASLPEILPYTRSDIQLEIRTGTIEVMDELIPDDEEEDIELKTRGKAGLSVSLQVSDKAD